MKIKLIIICLLLSACNDTIPDWVQHSAISNCGGQDKVHQVFYDNDRREGSVTCKNGIYYSIKQQESK